MLYKSRSEIEAARWMTLEEAILHICKVLGCDEHLAREQLMKAAADMPAMRRRIDPPPYLGPHTIPTQYFDPPQINRATVERIWRTKPVRLDGYRTAHESPKKRHTNGLDYRDRDQPFILRMKADIDAGKALSAEQAARSYSKEAVGGGTEASKVKRLAKHYREYVASQP